MGAGDGVAVCFVVAMFSEVIPDAETRQGHVIAIWGELKEPKGVGVSV